GGRGGGGGGGGGMVGARGFKAKRAAEPANAAHEPWTRRLSGKRPDRFDQGVARIDIDAGVAVGQRGLVFGFCRHARGLRSKMRGSSASAYQAADMCPSRPEGSVRKGRGVVTFARILGIC